MIIECRFCAGRGRENTLGRELWTIPDNENAVDVCYLRLRKDG